MDDPRIHGVIFSEGAGYASHRCDDPWHDVGRISSELDLTPEDRELLSAMKVKVC
jgi:hypothetical protein